MHYTYYCTCICRSSYKKANEEEKQISPSQPSTPLPSLPLPLALIKPLQILQPHNLQRPRTRPLQIHLQPRIRPHFAHGAQKVVRGNTHFLAGAMAFVRRIIAEFGL